MICRRRLTHIRKGYFLIQLPTTVGQLLGNIDERMPATVSRRILVTSVTIPLRDGKARILVSSVTIPLREGKAEQFVVRKSIRKSPRNESRNESIYESISFRGSSQFVVWGVSDTKVDTKVETFAALNVAFAAPNVAMTSVSLLSLLTMPCLTSSYLRSVSSCRAMSGVSSDRPAAKHDASGNATALSGSAPSLWNLWAVA